MGQIHYSFDPTSELELEGLFMLLNKYYDYIPDNPQKLRSANYETASDKDRTISELNERIKRYEEEAEKKRKEIDLLQSELQDVKDRAKTAEADNKQKTEELQKLKADNAQKEQKLIQDHQDDINKIKDEKGKEIAELNKDIADLCKRIAVYEPSLIGDTDEDKFFNIEGPLLNETMSDDAPVVGKVGIDGNAIYQFNVEKGPHKSLSQNTSDLENFFDIIESIDGANHISMGEWGKAKYHNGTMVVTSKAKIKLTRK